MHRVKSGCNNVVEVDGPLNKSVIRNYFSYFSFKTYVVGTQNNRLNETVILNTHNKCFNCG